jgi:3-oxoacyl-[acyl-carrier protein] reductase
MTARRTQFLEKWSVANNMDIKEAKANFLSQAKIERYGQPEEIAKLIAFLLSPLSKWITGTAIRIDGGEIKTI